MDQDCLDFPGKTGWCYDHLAWFSPNLSIIVCFLFFLRKKKREKGKIAQLLKFSTEMGEIIQDENDPQNNLNTVLLWV